MSKSQARSWRVPSRTKVVRVSFGTLGELPQPAAQPPELVVVNPEERDLDHVASYAVIGSGWA